ncbi:MAG: hypothetical protein ACM31D_08250 [Bacteroidota bacterium]
MALTDEQKNFLAPRISSHGVGLNVLEGRTFGPDTHNGPMIISNDPARDNLGSQPIRVESLQHMKALAGVPDSHFDARPGSDAHLTYLPPPTANFAKHLADANGDRCKLQSIVHHDDAHNVSQQMRTYVLGDSRKVAPEYVDMANAMHFPMMATYTPGEDIVITSANPLIIDSSWPSSLVFGRITIKSGGYIQTNTQVSITANEIISL